MHIPAVAAVHGRPLRQLSSVLAYVAASARLRPVLLDTGNLLSQGRSCCRPHHRKFICSTSTFINPQSSQMSWNGKTAVITGIARPAGIGQACASLLYKNGYNIVFLDVNKPQFAENAPWMTGAPVQGAAHQAATEAPSPRAAAAAAASVGERRPHCAWLHIDLSVPEQILSIPAQLQQLGVSAVHTLVNNAGMTTPYMKSDSLEERAALWAKHIATNLSAPFLLSEALQPLLTQKSSIIHISSTRALQSEPHCEGYSASKAGLLGLTHAQAASLAPKGVRVNAILPGWVDTSGENPPDITQEQHEWHWTGSVGAPSDIAELVLFLSDPSKSGFINGQHFVVDGGVTKRMTYP